MADLLPTCEVKLSRYIIRMQFPSQSYLTLRM